MPVTTKNDISEADLRRAGFTELLPDPSLISDLVAANHTLFDQGVELARSTSMGFASIKTVPLVAL